MWWQQRGRECLLHLIKIVGLQRRISVPIDGASVKWKDKTQGLGHKMIENRCDVPYAQIAIVVD
jgi:hypothetical protein